MGPRQAVCLKGLRMPIVDSLAPLEQLLDRLTQWTALAEAGITVSICCGPSGRDPFRWSVQALAADGREFEEPYAAASLQHAIEIAVIEVMRRGWLPPERNLSHAD
jgi:hypothetical protein